MVDQSFELRFAREGGQLVDRRQVESWKGFPAGETGEMGIVGIEETGNQVFCVRTGPGARWNTKGSPQSSQARQVWLKMDGKTEAVDLGEETGEELEEKVRRWMKVEKGMGLYVICERRRLFWEGFGGVGKTAEVMVELRVGMGKNKGKKNPWITPSQSSSGSEAEIIRTETEGSSAEERENEKLQEVLERKVTEALEEGGVLDQPVEVWR